MFPASFVPYEKRPPALFHSKKVTPTRYSTKIRRQKHTLARNRQIDDEKHLKHTKTRLDRMNKRLEKMKKCGIDYKYEPIDKPEQLVK